MFAVSAVLLMVLDAAAAAWPGRTRQRGVDDERRHVAGRSAVVTIAIDNHANTGQIRVGSEYWTARTPGDEDPPIPAGAVVRIESVAGVTARVVRAPSPASSSRRSSSERGSADRRRHRRRARR